MTNESRQEQGFQDVTAGVGILKGSIAGYIIIKQQDTSTASCCRGSRLLERTKPNIKIPSWDSVPSDLFYGNKL